MTWKIFIDMAASFWFFSSFLAKSISFYFWNQIYTALGFQKYSHCNKVLYISPWTIPFYTSDVSLLTKKSLIFAIFYKGESGGLLKYDHIKFKFSFKVRLGLWSIRLRVDPFITQQQVTEKHWKIAAQCILGKTKVERVDISEPPNL